MSERPARFEPERTCLGCRGRKPRAAMRRLVLVKTSEGPARVVWDAKGALPGRGAWLCGPACLALARKRRAFGRAFRTEAALDLGGLDSGNESDEGTGPAT